MTEYKDVFRSLLEPLPPIPTNLPHRLVRLEGIRAVLFDVYGTLLVSASGDVGTAVGESDAFAAALAAAGLKLNGQAEEGVAALHRVIGAMHAMARERGIDYPEVDLREVWRQALAILASAGVVAPPPDNLDYGLLAVHYEARVNPSWPMPGWDRCLASLRSRGLLLGVVSNAQFFTPILIETLMQADLEGLGFDPRLRYYSYRQGEAKPGGALYRLAADELEGRGVASGEVLYVGNDLLNDVTPAQQVGFRTALFAGDGRSLRLREGDPRVAGARPDLVLTGLEQLPDCLT